MLFEPRVGREPNAEQEKRLRESEMAAFAAAKRQA